MNCAHPYEFQQQLAVEEMMNIDLDQMAKRRRRPTTLPALADRINYLESRV